MKAESCVRGEPHGPVGGEDGQSRAKTGPLKLTGTPTGLAHNANYLATILLEKREQSSRTPNQESSDSSDGSILLAIFLPQACTNFHRVFARLLLPTFRDALSIRYRLIGKKNFTSQFRDGSEDKTELALPELIWGVKLRESILRRQQG
jgi:hypothetical protein